MKIAIINDGDEKPIELECDGFILTAVNRCNPETNPSDLWMQSAFAGLEYGEVCRAIASCAAAAWSIEFDEARHDEPIDASFIERGA